MTGPKLDWMTRPSHTRCIETGKISPRGHYKTAVADSGTHNLYQRRWNKPGGAYVWVNASCFCGCLLRDWTAFSQRSRQFSCIVFECWLFVKETKKRRFSFGGTNISAVSAFRAASAVSSSATYFAFWIFSDVRSQPRVSVRTVSAD